VADADFPRLVYDENELWVSFRDWRENEVEVRFPNCYAVRWQTAFLLLPGERDDEVFEIANSDWLALHREQEAVAPEESMRHFRLNFNAWGQLEVLAEDMMLLSRTPADAT
jgi:hypothetical protein